MAHRGFAPSLEGLLGHGGKDKQGRRGSGKWEKAYNSFVFFNDIGRLWLNPLHKKNRARFKPSLYSFLNFHILKKNGSICNVTIVVAWFHFHKRSKRLLTQRWRWSSQACSRFPEFTTSSTKSLPKWPGGSSHGPSLPGRSSWSPSLRGSTGRQRHRSPNWLIKPCYNCKQIWDMSFILHL